MATGTARHRLMTETYEDVERLIWDVVHKFHAKHGDRYGTRQELFSEGCFAFLRAYQRYNPSKGSFSTYVRNMTNYLLLELTRSETKRRIRMNVSDDDTEVADTSSPFSLSEFLDEVSEDTRAIVMLVLDTPGDLLHAMRGEDNDNIQYLLRQYLVGLGWAKERIAECFTEISHALS